MDVLGPVEGVYRAVQPGGRWIAEHELSDMDCAVGGCAVAEFGPAEQAGDVGVGGFGADLAGWPGLAELPADDDGQVVADAQCFVSVVGDVCGGDLQFGQQPLEQGTHVLAGGLVEGR